MSTKTEFEDFIRSGGKISAAVYPYGVDSNTENPKFSILFGFHSENIDQINIPSLGNFMEGFFDSLSEMNGHFQLKILDTGCDLSVKFNTAQFEEFKNRWKSRDIQNVMFKLPQNFPDDPPKGSGEREIAPFFELEDKILESLLVKPYDPISHLVEYLSERKRVNPEIQFSETDIAAYVNSVKNEVRNRKILYDSLNAKAREIKPHLIAASQQSSEINIYEIVNYIQRHPKAACEYGLLHHVVFNCNNYWKQETVSRDFTLDVGKEFEDKFKLNDQGHIDFDTFEARTLKINGIDKHYHGIPGYNDNYGCHKIGNNQNYHLLFINPEQNIQSAGFSAETIEKDFLTEGKIIELRDLKIPRTEGMILFKTTDKNSTLNENSENISGIIGQTVVAFENKDSLHSLCIRKAQYDFNFEVQEKEPIEEGWITPDVKFHGISKDYYGQVIFNWIGNNLAMQDFIYNSPESKDQKLKQDYEDKDYLKKFFEIKYDYVDYDKIKNNPTYRSLMLVEGKTYGFVLKNVYSNGYTIPIKSNNKFELSVSDILNYSEYLDIYSVRKRFNLKDPLRPPDFIMGNNEKDSLYSLVIRDKSDNIERTLQSPEIDFQFLHFLGKLQPESIASDINTYSSNTFRLLEISNKKDKLIKYIPDIRPDIIIIEPADWASRNLFFDKEKRYKEFTENGFLADSNGNTLDIINNINNNKINLLLSNLDSNCNNDDCENLKLSKVEKNIKVELRSGLQLNLKIKRGKAIDSKLADPVKFFLTGYVFETCVDESLRYPAQVFQITNAILPSIVQHTYKEQICSRPDSTLNINCDATRVFINLKLQNYDYRAIGKIKLISKGKWLSDDGFTAVINAKDWIKNNSECDKHKLLSTEICKEYFDLPVNLEEDGIYKNNFGFEFNFLKNSNYFNGYREGRPIIRMDIAPDSSLNLYYFKLDVNNIHLAKLKFLNEDIEIKQNSNGGIQNANIELTSGIKWKFIVGFKFDKNLSTLYAVLTIKNKVSDKESEICKHYFFNKKDEEIAKNEVINLTDNIPSVSHYVDNVPLPFNDLSEKNLQLSEDLTIKYCNERNREVWIDFIYDKEFFIYKTDKSAGFLKKDVTLLGSSRFSEFYSNNTNVEPLTLASFPLIIPNNKVPAEPSFQMYPLLLHKEEVKDGSTSKKRICQLMFEIDRPRQNGEYFALVYKLHNQAQIDEFCCALGRDITTKKAISKSEGDIFLPDSEKNEKYLKYAIPGIKTGRYLDKSYNLKLYNTYFDYEKNKWIFILDLSEKINEYKLYNPILKVVAANYQIEECTDEKFRVSTFTKPKYINVLSPRTISCKRENDMAYLDIESLGFIKLADLPADVYMNKLFYSIREKNTTGIHTKKPELIEIPKGGIKIKSDQTLCIYEFETFTNTNRINNDFFDDSGYRLIYAEEF